MADTCVAPPEGHCLADGLPMTGERIAVNLLSVIGGYVLFASCFYIAHDRPFDKVDGYGLLKRIYPEVWEKLDTVTRGDWASRLHSSLHAVVVLGLLPTMANCGIWGDALANDCRGVEVFFGITVGYFLFDYSIVLYYKMAFWQVFIVHHTFAISPYLINNFFPGSSACQYILGIFIQVEIATLVLNYQNMLELTERTGTATYKAIFYGCYLLWAVVRIAMPLYICLTLVNDVMPYYGSRPQVVVCYVCAFFVLTFCCIVWLFVLTPDVIAHLKGPTEDALLEAEGSAPVADEDAVPSTSFQIESRSSRAGSSSARKTSVWTAPQLTDTYPETREGRAPSEPVFRSRGSTLKA